MRTNAKTRETMTSDWTWFFNEIQTKYKWGKYYKDGGFRTCAYNTETDNSKILEAAPRRQKGARICLIGGNRQKTYEQIFNTNDIKVNEVFSTCSLRYGGLWVYDSRILATTPTKPRNGNQYFRIDRERCIKVCDVWDIPKFTEMSLFDIYHVARNQYEHMINENMYDKINTWEDLPDWCIWKYQNIDGTPIVGREKAFKEAREYVKGLKGYVAPYIDESSL